MAYNIKRNTGSFMAKLDKKQSTKEQLRLEYLIKASPKIIFNMLTSPSGLAEWFCDDVNIRNKEYTFKWDGSEEKAELLAQKENSLLRFRWLADGDEPVFFEYRIEVDELTNDVALVVIDFVEPGEKDSRILYWNNLIHKLMYVVGS